MHHLALIRSMSTRDNDHDTGRFSVMAGRRKSGLRYPDMGSVANKYLTPAAHPVPGYVAIERYDRPNEWSATFLGPKYEPVRIIGGKPPEHLTLPNYIDGHFNNRRQELETQTESRLRPATGKCRHGGVRAVVRKRAAANAEPQDVRLGKRGRRKITNATVAIRWANDVFSLGVYWKMA